MASISLLIGSDVHHFVFTVQSSSNSKLAAKKIVASYLIKWSNGEKRQRRKLKLLQPHKREKCFAKPEELI